MPFLAKGQKGKTFCREGGSIIKNLQAGALTGLAVVDGAAALAVAAVPVAVRHPARFVLRVCHCLLEIQPSCRKTHQ